MDFLQIMTPFLLASIGGLYTEYSGTTNVAVEGYITMAAFIYITICKLTGFYYMAVFITLLVIIILSYIQSTLTIKLKANPIVTGLAINMGFFGIISAVAFKLFKTKGVIILDKLTPFNTNPIVVISLLFPILTLIIINKTRFGLRLKVRGFSKKSLMYSNLNPDFYRIIAMIITAVFSGLAGIFLAMELRSFNPNISAGRGWISLVIIYLGRKNPIGILFGCIIFSTTQILSNIGQSQAIPSDIILASPYVITLIALILTSRSKKLT